jgi:cell division septal protein FtsQ
VSVSAPADKRFRRPSVRPAQGRGFPRLVRWAAVRTLLLVAIVLGGLYLVATLVTGAALFQVRHVTVRGNSRLSTGEVLALISGVRDDSVLTANLAAYQRQLVESPWVADAALRRVLPGTIEVTVRERAPMGLCRLAEELYLVDGTGTIIDEFGPQYADFDLPIIDGLSGAPREGSPSIDAARADLAGRVMRAIAGHASLARRVSQIDVSNAHDAVVILDGETALLHLGDTQFAERLQAYLELAPALHARVPNIDYVDLRFDERVYVRPSRTSDKR